MTNMINTPRTMDELSTQWLSDALSAKVTEFSVQIIGAGQGFMGQLGRVQLSGVGAPKSVIVKLPTADPGGQVMGQMMRVWEREHRFYTEVAPRMGDVRLAKCLYSTAEPYALILEDLAPAESGDQVAGPTPDQARRVIDAAAILHSSWFDHPDLALLDWMPDISDPMTATIGSLFDVGWPTFLERYESSLPTRVLRWCETFAPMIESWIQTYSNWPCTLTHGDFRLDNMFFGDDGTLTLIDWQLSMRAPCTTDLVYFIGTNLPREMRRTMQDELIDRYVAGLLAGGVSAEWANKEKIFQGLAEGVLFFCTSFGASILSLDPANERGAALMDSLVRRAFAAADDLDAGTRIGL
ncbi:hypothetical protein LBMAG13_03830 [Actinomycetes bacterium]|nr:hypothetical protein LBMAG13_03830 [Actinomycetes bacterium]